MARNTKLYSILSILIVLGLIFSVFYGLKYVQQTAISGFSTLSLTQAILKSDNPYLNGKAWLLTIVQGGLGQSAYGTITPSDILDKTNSDKPTKNLNIEINYNNQDCIYPITRNIQEPDIYKISKKEFFCLTGGFQDEEWFKQQGEALGIPRSAFFGWYGKYSLSTTCFVTYITESTKPGYFGNVNVEVSGSVKLDVDGKIATKDWNTLTGSTQGSIGDYAYMVWQGNLDTGKSCPNSLQNPFKPVYRNGQWFTIDATKYTKYSTLYDSFVQKLYTGIPVWNFKEYVFSSDGTTQFINDFNTFSQNTLTSYDMGAIDNQASLTDSKVRIQVQDATQKPVITLYVKAETLGIYTPTPKVNVLSTDARCFNSAERDARIAVELYNPTTVDFVGSMYGSCDTPFSVQRTDVNVPKQVIRTIYMPISASGTNEVNANCRLTIESPGELNTFTSNVCYKPEQTCTPGQSFCDVGNVIKRCNADGTKIETVQVCTDGSICSLVNNQPTCKKDDQAEICDDKKDNDADNKIDCDDSDCASDSACQNVCPPLFKSLLFSIPNPFCGFQFGGTFKTLIAILSTFVIFAVSLNQMRKLFPKKSDNTMNTILSIIIALIVGFIIYLYFWYGVILAILLLIIRFIIKYFIGI